MADFEKCLADTIASYTIPADICKAIHLDNHSRLINSDSLRRRLFKINAHLIAWSADFNRVSLVGAPLLSKRVATRLTFRQKYALFCENITSKRWPATVLIVYLIIMVVLGINTWFQYIQDANLIRLHRMEEHLSVTSEYERLVGVAQLDINQLRWEFNRKIDDSRQVLELMGASLIGWTFIPETLNVLLFQTIDWLVVIPIHSLYYDWILLAAKAIIDENDETKTRVQMILAEQGRFKQDSWLFSRTRLMRLRRDLKMVLQGNNSKTSIEFIQNQRIKMIINKMIHDEHRQLIKSHDGNLRLFKLVALRGRMNPLNRTPSMRDKLALIHISTYVLYIVYTHIVVALMVYTFNEFFMMHRSWRPSTNIEGLKDLWTYSYYILLTEIVTLSASFYLTIFACSISDQIELSKQVQALVKAVIRANEQRFEELVSIDGKNSSRTRFGRFIEKNSDQFNSSSYRVAQQLGQTIELDLVMLVAQFRLAVASFELSRGPLQRITFSTILFALSIPFVWMLHSAYFEPDLRLIVLGSGAATTLCCLTFLIPVAWLYRRHVCLLTTLWTLVAQLTQYEISPGVNNYIQLNSCVSLFIFRRILSDPKLLVDRLSVTVFSMPVTYTNLIRTFTYCVIFTMAGGFMTLRLLGDGLASIMVDPFGLFKFLKIN